MERSRSFYQQQQQQNLVLEEYNTISYLDACDVCDVRELLAVGVSRQHWIVLDRRQSCQHLLAEHFACIEPLFRIVLCTVLSIGALDAMFGAADPRYLVMVCLQRAVCRSVMIDDAVESWWEARNILRAKSSLATTFTVNITYTFQLLTSKPWMDIRYRGA
jgi:hypothetical protein